MPRNRALCRVPVFAPPAVSRSGSLACFFFLPRETADLSVVPMAGDKGGAPRCAAMRFLAVMQRKAREAREAPPYRCYRRQGEPSGYQPAPPSASSWGPLNKSCACTGVDGRASKTRGAARRCRALATPSSALRRKVPSRAQAGPGWRVTRSPSSLAQGPASTFAAPRIG